jgi:hypothetical protein
MLFFQATTRPVHTKLKHTFRPSVARDVLIALGRFDVLTSLHDVGITRLSPARSEAHESLTAAVTSANPDANVAPHTKPHSISAAAMQDHDGQSAHSPALAPTSSAAQSIDAMEIIPVHRGSKRKRSSSLGWFIVALSQISF